MQRRGAAAVLGALGWMSILGWGSPVSAEAGTANDPGSITEHTYTNSAGTRRYFVYRPAGAVEGRPLVIWLHGCSNFFGGPTSEEENVARVKPTLDSPLLVLARKLGFVAVYPVQTIAANAMGCWNWNYPAHQQRGAGEPSLVSAITRQVLGEAHLDAHRVYIAGHSAGGAMTTVLGATYPDLYAAIAPIASCPYLSCLDAAGLAAYLAMGAYARPMPAFIVQSTLDLQSPYPIGRLVGLQWLQTDDFADDGLLNFSISRTAASTENRPASPEAGLAHPQVFEHHDDKSGKPLIDFVTLVGGDHRLNGDWGILTPLVDFLLAHPR